MLNERIHSLTKIQFTLVKAEEHLKKMLKNTPYTKFDHKQYMHFSFVDMFFFLPKISQQEKFDIVEIV